MSRSSKSPARRVRPPRRPLLRTAAATALTVLAAGVGLVGMGSTDAQAATLVAVPSFGSNPANLTMYTYVPDNRATRPKILVLVHGCALDAPSYFGAYGRDFRTAADRYGFVIVMPDNRRQGNCFDVATPNGLRRDGGSDSTSIASMVRYAQGLYGVGRADTVIAGSSSGAMTTNVMAAEYPDLFAAGAAYMGVPASCFATNSATNLWNSACANGQVRKTAAQWADAARAMYPGYTGTYPRMQLLHGTADSILLYPNLAEEIKQWTALHSLSQTPVLQDTPQASWTRTRYGSTGAQAPVEAISVAGAGHDFPRSGMVAGTVTFLGLDQPDPRGEHGERRGRGGPQQRPA
uniref:extracellular catalytic domain type 1 short-chain-length polyhydroxyalkanoate depolymerase n=1 Tax=Kineosporia sp. R_H_3 TaxID=1961848 RepID=UPI0018E9B879